MNIFNKVTVKTMKHNRTRTIVTIIGVILSAAMFTAVTTFCSSLMDFLARTTIYNDGNYHIAVNDISYPLLEELEQDKNTDSISTMQYVGYAVAENDNENKPYFYIGAADSEMFESMPVHLTSGRLPQNDTEIILPEHYYNFNGKSYAIGDTLILDIGERTEDGAVLNQRNPFITSEDGGNEQLTVREKRTYTVVGTYERPNFEPYSAPGYTALTVQSGNTQNATFSAFIKLHKVSSSIIEDYITAHNLEEYGTQINWDLLSFSGVFQFGNYGTAIYSLGAIFIFLILLGSVALIYSAFSISVSERTRQFGLLSSIGATKRQIKRSMRFEAAAVSIIGIPIGIIVGIVGMWITFLCVGDKFSSIMSSPYSVNLKVSWLSILLAIIIALSTVFISSWIPCRRATKITAIDAIRQSRDININGKKVKTSKITYKLFGLEGMLAKKYFKRSRKKYRATVVSLTLSIILFVSASSFCMYLTDATSTAIQIKNYDVSYNVSPLDKNFWAGNAVDNMLADIKSTDGVTDAVFSRHTLFSLFIPENDRSNEYNNFLNETAKENGSENLENYEVANIYYLDDVSYRNLVEANSLDKNIYLNNDNPPAIVVNSQISNIYSYNSDTEESDRVTRSYDYLKKDVQSLTVIDDDIQIEGYTYINMSMDEENGKLMGHYIPEDEVEIGDRGEFIITEETLDKSMAIPLTSHKIDIGAKISAAPLGVEDSSNMELIYPMSALSQEYDYATGNVYMKAKNSETLISNVKEIAKDYGLRYDDSCFYNVSEQQQTERNFVVIVNVFSYGFIVLISLISVANVFNTISTNVSLRRRDFAMLRSVGMTSKGMNRMMNYECILYGTKALIFGLPVALAVTFLIYSVILDLVVTSFTLPWIQILIAVISVFIVVGASMLYTMRKIKKDNLIDTLKNENI